MNCSFFAIHVLYKNWHLVFSLDFFSGLPVASVMPCPEPGSLSLRKELLILISHTVMNLLRYKYLSELDRATRIIMSSCIYFTGSGYGYLAMRFTSL